MPDFYLSNPVTYAHSNACFSFLPSSHVPYKPAPLTAELLYYLLYRSSIPKVPVVLCIGTDRILGDSLGPLTGSLLQKKCTGQFAIYGTLQEPAHALNLAQINAAIKKKHPDSPVIAIDASLGSSDQIGSVFVRAGSISPGAGVRKSLPPSGTIAITGVVNEESLHPYLALQTARLSVVAAMAEQIADCILEILS